MKHNEQSQTQPTQFQNGEKVLYRLWDYPTINAMVRATKSTATTVFYDLDLWNSVEGGAVDKKDHTRIYNVESRFVHEIV